MTDSGTITGPLHLGLDSRSEKIMFIIAGCNGAGKTTAFRSSLYDSLGRPVFINPDEIAHLLCPEDVESVQASAGRMAIESLQEHLNGNESFCVETTLATRVYQGYINQAHRKGFKVALFYYWLDSPDLAVVRVEQRVVEGGHYVLENIIRERYDKSIRYLTNLYIPKVDYWKIVNNSSIVQREIATSVRVVKNQEQFDLLIRHGQGN
jgi:predicted ABC-type ATPase